MNSSRSAVLAIIDQGLWTITNFMLLAVLANVVPVGTFGVIGIAYGGLVIAVGVTLALSGEVLGVARGHSGDGSLQGRVQLQRSALATVVCMAVVAPVLMWGVTFAAGVVADEHVVLMAAFAPVVVMAEGTRSIAYGLQEPKFALRQSLTWIVINAMALGGLLLSWTSPGVWAIAAWGAGAASAALIGMVQVGVRPKFGSASSGERRRRRHFVYEYLLTAGPAQVMVVLASLMLSVTDAASLRALQTVYGPLNVVLTGLRNTLVPIYAGRSRGRIAYGVWTAGIALTAVVLASVLLTVLPELGKVVMAKSWPSGLFAVWAFAITRIAAGVTLGAMIVLRANDATESSTRLRSLTAFALLSSFMVGGQFGLSQALFATAGAGLLMAVLWWRTAFGAGRSFLAQG